MDIQSYLRGRKQELKENAGSVRDYTVFDLNYIPAQPILREESKPIIDALLQYDHTGIPKNLAIFGSRGSGKTLMVRFLAKELRAETGLSMLYINVRNHNTSFKILAHFLRVQARGASFDELFNSFSRKYSRKTVVVLDEVDLISAKDRQVEILYRLSRSSKNYMIILLSNSPRLMQAIDPSARSTLQPVILHFRNYDADQIYRILLARAEQGLNAYNEEDLFKIAARTRRDTNSDVRVGIKCLFYKATEPTLNVDSAFEQASRDVVVDVVRDLNDKCLIILESVRRSTGRFVKEVYQCYKRLSDQAGEAPFSYMHFYNNLSYLQSCGLIILVAARVARTYSNRIRLLADGEVVSEAFKQRFA